MPKAICANSTRFPSAHPFTAGAAGPAPATLSTHRRSMLAGAAAALVAGGVAAVPLPASAEPVGADAALLADIHELTSMCTEHNRLIDQTADLMGDDPRFVAANKVFAADRARFHELRERIARTPARTPAEATAKAALAVLLFKYDFVGYPAEHWDSAEAVAVSALRDLMGRVPA